MVILNTNIITDGTVVNAIATLKASSTNNAGTFYFSINDIVTAVRDDCGIFDKYRTELSLCKLLRHKVIKQTVFKSKTVYTI